MHYLLAAGGRAGLVARRRLRAGAQGRARPSGRHHPGGDMSAAATAAPAAAPAADRSAEVTRILPGMVPTTLVHDINLAHPRRRIRRHHRSVRLGQIIAAVPAGPARSSDLRRRADRRQGRPPHMTEDERAQLAAHACWVSCSSFISCCPNSPSSKTSRCRCARSACCRRARSRARARAAGVARTWRPSAQEAGPTVRRPAAARRRGTRACQRSRR